MRNLVDLTGKVALVTGGSSGIGAATAELLAELGAKVAIGYYSSEAGARQVSEKLARARAYAITIRADVRSASEIRAMVERTHHQLGPIDILVNNAGSLIERQPLLEMTAERWNESIKLNLDSAMYCSQAVAPSMIARGTGAIINVVSIAGRSGGGQGAGAYATAKGGMIAFTKALAKELAPNGVRVNAVSPGVIDTRFHEQFSTPEMIESYLAGIPLGRMGTAAECAGVIAFLASEAASYIVGETIEVNGGQLML